MEIFTTHGGRAAWSILGSRLSRCSYRSLRYSFPMNFLGNEIDGQGTFKNIAPQILLGRKQETIIDFPSSIWGRSSNEYVNITKATKRVLLHDTFDLQ